jgi:hypothetical protein
MRSHTSIREETIDDYCLYITASQQELAARRLACTADECGYERAGLPGERGDYARARRGVTGAAATGGGGRRRGGDHAAPGAGQDAGAGAD